MALLTIGFKYTVSAMRPCRDRTLAVRVLGIETSCDETAVAIVEGAPASHTAPILRANLVLSQIADHAPYGGVVPEVAARAHLVHLGPLVRRALAETGVTLDDVDAIAATGGPGLIGGVIVGVTMAKAMAQARGLPFLAINHLEAHALTARLTDGVSFPYLLLLVSGGHSQLLVVEGVGRYRLLGTTIDDAVGEAFDKTAKILGLGYPGGPAVERAALAGDPARFALPRPLLGRPGCDFSFSGLKAAVKRTVDWIAAEAGLAADGHAMLADREVADMCAAFQAAAADCIEDRTRRALALLGHGAKAGSGGDAGLATPLTALVVAGGVAANGPIRARLRALADAAGLPFVAPPLALCGDNAAMVAWAGIERAALGQRDGLDFAPRPRWPLAESAAIPAGQATA